MKRGDGKDAQPIELHLRALGGLREQRLRIRVLVADQSRAKKLTNKG